MNSSTQCLSSTDVVTNFQEQLSRIIIVPARLRQKTIEHNNKSNYNNFTCMSLQESFQKGFHISERTGIITLKAFTLSTSIHTSHTIITIIKGKIRITIIDYSHTHNYKKPSIVQISHKPLMQWNVSLKTREV